MQLLKGSKPEQFSGTVVFFFQLPHLCTRTEETPEPFSREAAISEPKTILFTCRISGRFGTQSEPLEKSLAIANRAILVR